MFTARILAIECNVTTRKAREAIEIRDRRPAVNRNIGRLPDGIDNHTSSQMLSFTPERMHLHMPIVTPPDSQTDLQIQDGLPHPIDS